MHIARFAILLLACVALNVAAQARGPREAELLGVYEKAMGKLRRGDVEGALSHFTPAGQARHRPMFESLRPRLATVVDNLGTVGRVSVADRSGEIELTRETPTGRQVFPVIFLKGRDGAWKIDSM